MRSNFPKIGQGIESFDFPDHSTHAEQARKVPKHGELIQIEPEPFVSEQLSDVQEIPCTAAEIENSLRTHQIDFDFANPANVDANPPFEIQKFGPVLGGTFNGVTLPDLLETLGIDRFDYSLRLQTKTVWQKKTERVPSCTGQAFAI